MAIPLAEKLKQMWISERTLKLAQEKRKIRLKANESEEDKQKYKKLCNEVRSSARKDKQNWLEKKCNDMEQYAGEFKTREVYKLIRSINRKWQPKQAAIKNKDGNILIDKQEITQRWTEYCSEL